MKKNTHIKNNNIYKIIKEALILSSVATIISQPVISSANDINYNSPQENEIYIKLAFGASKSIKPKGFYDNKVGNPSFYNIGLGGKLVSNNRIEINYIKHGNFKCNSKHRNELLKDNIHTRIKSETIMLNFYSDQYFSDIYTPYFGLGLGYSKNKANFSSITNLENIQNFQSSNINQATKKSFAWQFILGVKLPIHDRIDFDLSYRYSDLGKIPYPNDKITVIGKKAHGKLRTQALLFGIHFKI